MPFYRAYCETCDEYVQVMSSMEDRNEPQECPECGNDAKRDDKSMAVEGQGMAAHVLIPYFDENLCTDENPDGTFITSKGHKKKVKRDAGVRERGSFIE